jgi:glutamate carboxypeptidase
MLKKAVVVCSALVLSPSVVAADLAAITEAVKKSEEFYVKTVESLVSIDSDTGNLAGSQKVAAYLEREFKALGAKVELVESTKPGGVHVIARFQGDGRQRVLLYGHSDTVLSSKAGYEYRYDPVKKIAYGPGAADSKGSVAMLVESVKLMQRLKMAPYKELIVYIDAEEEGGSDTEKKLIEKLAREADLALIADTGRPDFGIVTKRKASGNYTFKIKGISGHAGNAPQATANALVEAGYLITALYKLQSPMPRDPAQYGTTALKAKGVVDRGQFIPANAINVAVIEAPNTKTNVVPDEVNVKVNLRTFEQKEFERIEKAMFDLAKREPHRQGITVAIEGAQSSKPLELKGASLKLVETYKQTAKRAAGVEATEWVAGGVTPANDTAIYIPTIDCIGVDSDPMLEHSTKEELQVAAYVPRTVTLLQFLQEVDKLVFSKKAPD